MTGVRRFSTASGRTQIGRLRRVAQRALDRWNIEADQVVVVHHGHNTTFRVRAGKRTYALRVYRAGWRSPAAVAGECEWLRALARDTALGAPRPSRPITTIPASDDLDDDRVVGLFTWVRGGTVNGVERPLQARHAAAIGRVAAELHDHATNWNPPPDFERPRCRLPGLLGTDLEVATLRPPERDRIEPLLRRCEAAFDRLDAAGSPFGLVHSDLHVGNARFDGERARPIDFDDSCFRHFAFDLAISAESIAHRGGTALVDALLDGYRSRRALPARFEEERQDLRLARRIELILWISYFRNDRGFMGNNVERWIAEQLGDLEA